MKKHKYRHLIEPNLSCPCDKNNFAFHTYLFLYYSLKDGNTFVSYCPDCDGTKQKVINDFRAIGVCDDYFISYLKIHTINKYKKEIEARPDRMVALIGNENIDLIKSIDLSDNPVLVLYKMK